MSPRHGRTSASSNTVPYVTMLPRAPDTPTRTLHSARRRRVGGHPTPSPPRHTSGRNRSPDPWGWGWSGPRPRHLLHHGAMGPDAPVPRPSHTVARYRYTPPHRSVMRSTARCGHPRPPPSYLPVRLDRSCRPVTREGGAGSPPPRRLPRHGTSGRDAPSPCPVRREPAPRGHERRTSRTAPRGDPVTPPRPRRDAIDRPIGGCETPRPCDRPRRDASRRSVPGRPEATARTPHEDRSPRRDPGPSPRPRRDAIDRPIGGTTPPTVRPTAAATRAGGQDPGRPEGTARPPHATAPRGDPVTPPRPRRDAIDRPIGGCETPRPCDRPRRDASRRSEPGRPEATARGAGLTSRPVETAHE